MVAIIWKSLLLSVLEGPWISMQADIVCSYRAAKLLYDSFLLLQTCLAGLTEHTHVTAWP